MKKSIHSIQAKRIGGKLGLAKKRISAAVAVIALPLAICAGLFSTPTSWAQPQKGSKPSFEVASIKVAENCGNTAPGMRAKIPSAASYQPGGHFAICGQLRWILMEAYQIKLSSQLTGVPGWSDDILYRIEAKAEGNPDKEQMHLMVQSLLEDRFKLKIHSETREAPVYALVVAKGGYKFRLAKDEQGNPLTSLPPPDPAAKKPVDRPTGRSITESEMKSMITPGNSLGIVRADGGVEYIGKAITMKQFAESFYSIAGSQRKVFDNTGLTGLYDVDWVYPISGFLIGLSGGFQSGRGSGPNSRGTADSAPTSAPDIFAALQEQLGLKLESTKAPLDYFIVDSVEKPSEN